MVGLQPLSSYQYICSIYALLPNDAALLGHLCLLI
jgi:hypothetical protein